MTFTSILKALGLFKNDPPEPSCNPESNGGTPAPATSESYNPGCFSPPNIVYGYPVNNNYAPPPACYYNPPQPAPTYPAPLSYDNATFFVPHDDSEGLKRPNAINSTSIARPDQQANSKISTSYANPQLPKNNGLGDKNIGENNGKRKNGRKRRGKSSGGDSFKVHGNTINGGKGDKVGVFDFSNKYNRGRKRSDKEEDSTEEESDSGTEDERDYL